jgi:pseudoazurin
MKIHQLAISLVTVIGFGTWAVAGQVATHQAESDGATAGAAEYTVAMKNTGADGIMVFEPAVIRVNVGDTVHFMPTDMAHNSESVEGLTPEGSVTWRGAMNQKVSVTLDKEGVYVYQCQPHAMLAMVGVIVAGEPVNLAQIQQKSVDYAATFATNKDRLDTYITSLQ